MDLDCDHGSANETLHDDREEEYEEEEEEEEEIERHLHDILDCDDKDYFMSLIYAKQDKPKKVPFDYWNDICVLEAKECANALFNSEASQDVEYEYYVPPPYWMSLLHMAAKWHWPWFVDFLLRKGAPSDLRISHSYTGSGTEGYSKLWSTAEPPVFRILIYLCLRDKRKSLETIRLLVTNMKKVEEEIFYYATEGKLLEFAALLLVTREKVLAPSFFEKLSTGFQSKIDGRLDGSMTLRSFIVAKLASLAAMQLKPVYYNESYNISRMCKEKEAVMTSTLLLLEVFERVGEDLETYLRLEDSSIIGDDIDAFLQRDRDAVLEKQVAREVSGLLHKAGFTLKYEDLDQSYLSYIGKDPNGLDLISGDFIPRTYAQPDLTNPECLLLLGDSYGQKREREFHCISAESEGKDGDKENSSTIWTSYADWRMDSAYHLYKSTNFLVESLKAPWSSTTNLGSDGALLKAFENLRNHPCLKNWTLKNSLLELIYILCSPELSESLKTIGLQASNPMEIGIISCHYVKEGKFVELAALLMVARKKLTDRIVMPLDGSSCSSCESLVRQCIMLEIQHLIENEVRSIGRSPTGKSAQSFKDEKGVMLRALQLVEVFEKAGDAFDKYVHFKRYSEITKEELIQDVAWLLREAGFTLRQRDLLFDDLQCFSNNMRKEQSGRLKTVRGVGLTLASQSCTFPPEKENMAMLCCRYSSTRSFYAIQSYDTFRISQGSVLRDSFPIMRTEAGQTTKKVKSCEKLAFLAFSAVKRRVKCI